MSEPTPPPARAPRAAPAAVAAYTGATLGVYWLARSFIPPELGHSHGDEGLLAREALAGAIATTTSSAWAFARRLLARRFPEVLE